MCLLVTRAPSSTLCASALEELDHLCALFEEAQTKYKIINNLVMEISPMHSMHAQVLDLGSRLEALTTRP